MNGSKFVVECLIFFMCRGSLGGKYYWKDWSRTMRVLFWVTFCAPSWIMSYVQAVLTPDMWDFDVIPSIRPIPGIPAVTWL